MPVPFQGSKVPRSRWLKILLADHTYHLMMVSYPPGAKTAILAVLADPAKTAILAVSADPAKTAIYRYISGLGGPR